MSAAHLQPLVECVPNFSEGRDPEVIQAITDAIESAEGVALLDVDPGAGTHRSVVTFVGAPDAIVEGAFRGIKAAAERIDMSRHSGEHPRMGATDVCPLVPVANISMEEVVALSEQLAERVGSELGIPVYLYERSARKPDRRSLSSIRQGEYEGLRDKLAQPEWAPDYGPATYNARSGATVIGARDFLVAYNLNLNSTSSRRAFAIAFDLREQGRMKRIGDPIVGKPALDENGEQIWIPGSLKAVKGIGWYIPEYGISQVSMNLTDLSVTPLHIAFEAGCDAARERGLRVTGSELVGMVPLRVMLDAGRYFLARQQRSLGLPDEEIVRIAVKSMGLDELAPFDPRKKIIEYRMQDGEAPALYASMSLDAFSVATASEEPAPGGGSSAAYVGALGASLGAMVANVSANKRGWDARWEAFSRWAERGERLRVELLHLVDEDSRSFDAVLEAYRLPQDSSAEREARAQAVEAALRHAVEVPARVVELALDGMDVAEAMLQEGAPDAMSDACMAAICARAAAYGAYYNVRINAPGLKDRAFADEVVATAAERVRLADERERKIRALADERI